MKMEPASRAKGPILVTGAHRSGTTWVGKMLAAGPQMVYLSEPLNVLHRPGVLRAPVKYWYTYIHPENEADYLPAFQELLRFQYHTWAEIRALRSTKDLLRLGRDWSAFQRGRLFGGRPLLKDPFAVFSVPWFARRLGCAVVITVRHPAAFASSLLRLGWAFDFRDLLAQPLLMRDWLEPFRPAMEQCLADPEDVIGQASLLWRMIYSAVAQMEAQDPQFLVVRHEDLSRDPMGGFKNLYDRLGLAFSPPAQEAVLRSSGENNPGEVSRRAVHSVRLDSRANLQNWQRRLSPAEIERIHALTADVAANYYADGDWE
jgi:hypothetical protein